MDHSMGCGCQKCSGGWKSIFPFLSRIFLSLLFIIVGWSKITNFAGTASYIAAAGIPMSEIATVVAIILELGGGVALLIGFHPRVAAKMLAVFTILATAIYHRNVGDPMQALSLLKNLGILGGLMQVMVYGGGRWRVPYPKCPSKMCPDCSQADCACCNECNCSSCKSGVGQKNMGMRDVEMKETSMM